MPKPYTIYGKEILKYLAVAGVITIVAIAPRLAPIIWKTVAKNLDPKQKERGQRKKFYQALSRLKKSRLFIVGEKANDTFTVQLTEKGKRKVKEIHLEELKVQKPKHWDEIWRMVIFDIPNTKNKAREALRLKLRDLGFYQLQKSVWVIPYPCQAEIEFLIELFAVYPHVQLIDAIQIKNDALLKKHFHLF